jgi:hypothetical protein
MGRATSSNLFHPTLNGLLRPLLNKKGQLYAGDLTPFFWSHKITSDRIGIQLPVLYPGEMAILRDTPFRRDRQGMAEV